VNPAGMTIDSSSGVILWNPTAGDIGVHDVSVEVSDGEATATQAFTISVLAACPNGACEPNEDPCSCSQDCGTPPGSEIPSSTCADGIDNDCDGYTDCADADCAGDAVACPFGRIPTVSAWGVAVMTLLVLTAGTIVIRRSKREAPIAR